MVDGETTLPPTWAQHGLGQRKTEAGGSYLRGGGAHLTADDVAMSE